MLQVSNSYHATYGQTSGTAQQAQQQGWGGESIGVKVSDWVSPVSPVLHVCTRLHTFQSHTNIRRMVYKTLTQRTTPIAKHPLHHSFTYWSSRTIFKRHNEMKCIPIVYTTWGMFGDRRTVCSSAQVSAHGAYVWRTKFVQHNNKRFAPKRSVYILFAYACKFNSDK